jgi:translocation and assembly module TamB
MTEPESMPPVPPEQPSPEAASSSPQPPRAPSRLRRFFLRHLPLSVAAAAVLLAAVSASLYFWASSAGFEDLVRRRIIHRMETATGGRVEIASFHWSLRHLEADAAGVVIHGLEAPGEVPYARVERLRVRLSVLGFWSPRILLRDLDVFRPGLHLIVYPDGSTNQPQPRKRRKPGKPALDTFFDLKAGHVSIEQGELDYESRAASFDFQDRFLPLDLDAADVSLRAAYVPAENGNPESYRIEAGASHLNLFRGDARTVAQAAHGRVDATLDLTRNAAYLRSLRLSASGHELVVSGTLQNFARPRWEAKVSGDLDMRLLDPITGYNFAPEGIARLDLSSAGEDGQFRTDGTVHVDGGSYIGTGVLATGVGLDARVHADPAQLLITSIVVRLRQGGQIEGDVALNHWLAPVPGTPVLQPAARAASDKSKLPAPPPSPETITIPVNGKVTATFKNVSLDTLLDMVGNPPFQRLGLDTRVNGPAVATWINGDNRTLAVSASLALSQPGQTITGEVASSGMIDATYTQRDGAVDLRQLELRTPSSQLEARGHLGAYPLTSPSALAVDFHSRNLWEFDPVLRDLGLARNGKQGTAALPGVLLGGEATFHGTWSGSLSDPRLAGNAKATQLALELPANPNDKSGKPQWVRFDSAEAAGSYSAARIDISRAQFNRGQGTIALDGSLVAASAPLASGATPVPAFDANSMLRMHARASKANLDDWLPLTGQNLPVTGLLNAQFDATGPLHALTGSGWVELDGGTVYGEPVSRIRIQGAVANQVVKLTSATLNDEAGKIQLNGSYDLKSRRFQLDARSAGFDLSRIEWLRHHGLAITGKLGFSVAGSGTFDDPRLEARANVAGLALSGEPLGSVDFVARTANRMVTYDMTTRLEAAELSLHGQTALSGDNATQAKLEFSRFNIGALLRQAHIESLNGESALAGTVTVEGPLTHIEQLRGEARLQQLAVTVAGVHLHSEGGVHATLANACIHLDPLHVTGEETDLHAQGSLALKDKQQLDFSASGAINLKVAQTIDPDLTANGNSTFEVEAHGPLRSPGLRGRVDFHDASISLEDLPNGLSQLNGTLEFNQNRLEVKSLTAMTGGGLLSVGGYLAYQNGLFADLSATGKGIRIRYPQGVSSLADATLHLQGPRNNLLLSGNVLITRFSISPDLDMAALATQAGKVQTVAPPDAPSNHIRLDVHVVSSPQLNFQNAYAKLAGDVDLRLRGTVASPSLLGRVSITEGTAMIAGTRYDLQRGDITFTNPVRIQPNIDLNATARVEDYDITLGLHGTLQKPTVTYRSDPPLPEADVVALLALGRTENQQRIYTQQQEQNVANPTTDALLGGALNATVSSRVQKLFGAGSVKVDPNYLGALGNSTSRVIVEEQLGPNVTLTYATNVNTTAQQLIQAEVAINRHVSVQVARDESGVFSMVFKATRRYR